MTQRLTTPTGVPPTAPDVGGLQAIASGLLDLLLECRERAEQGAAERAETALWVLVNPKVETTCKWLTRNLHDAEDASNTTWLLFFERVRTGKIQQGTIQRGGVVAYIRKIASNVCCDLVREKEKEKARQPLEVMRSKTLRNSRPEAPDCSLMAREEEAILQREVSALHPKQRDVVTHYILEDHTGDATSALLEARHGEKVCVNTVRSRAKSACAALRARLRPVLCLLFLAIILLNASFCWQTSTNKSRTARNAVPTLTGGAGTREVAGATPPAHPPTLPKGLGEGTTTAGRKEGPRSSYEARLLNRGVKCLCIFEECDNEPVVFVTGG